MKSYFHLDEIHSGYQQRGAAIHARLIEYQNIPQQKYFYELLYCIMTPQSTAVNAGKVQRQLEEMDFQHRAFNPEPILRQRNHYIRFHKTKAERMVLVKRQFDSIFNTICSHMPANEKRLWLVRHVNGLSYKEATHFLRNIGMNDGLAILDRHILKNLKRHGVIRSLPTVLTKRRYLMIEKKFQKFAIVVGISVDELDLLFWSNETGEILK